MAWRTKNDRGAVAVFAVLFVLVAMVLLAFVVDRGRMYITRTQLQNTVDAAALAAAQAFCGGSGAAKDLAEEYGTKNGVTLDKGRMLPSTPTTWIYVPASQQVNLVFGGFVGTPRVAVGAVATATRDCTQTYRFVADDTITFDGNSADLRNVGFYAAKCFIATGSSNQFGTISVGTDGPGATSICNNKDPINIAPNTVQTALYGVRNPPIATAPTVDRAAIECLLPACGLSGKSVKATVTDLSSTAHTGATWVGDCDTGTPATGYGTMPTGNATLYCTSDFKKMDTTYTGIVVAQGDVDLANGLYSNVLIASVSGKITLNNATEIASGTVLYAPGGVVTGTGNPKVDLGAIIFANSMKFAGSGVGASGGIDAYGPGPISLTQ